MKRIEAFEWLALAWGLVVTAVILVLWGPEILADWFDIVWR